MSDQVNSFQNDTRTLQCFFASRTYLYPCLLFCLVLGTLKGEGRWTRETFSVLRETLNDFELEQSTHFCKTILNCDSSIGGSGVNWKLNTLNKWVIELPPVERFIGFIAQIAKERISIRILFFFRPVNYIIIQLQLQLFMLWILVKSQLFVPVPKVSTHTTINIIVNTFTLKLYFN
jgi:hypothetical protein